MEILISGASTGIGKACAIHLARTGHSVWAGVRTQKNFDHVNKMNLKGLRPDFLEVTDDASVKDANSLITKTAGTLNALINNAGVAVGGPVEAVSMDEWQRQFDTNFFGVIRLTQACLPLLRECKGRIVNMSSISGRMAFPFLGPYAASKFALEAMSDSLRRELLPYGVHVAIVEPGAIATPIWEKSKIEGLSTAAGYSKAITELYGASLQKLLKRVDDIAKNAAPVSVVTRAVEHALFSRTPRTRYPVGKGVKTTALLANVIPDQWMDRALRSRR
jgi:NAD(P)-dependent dehydrogenase (short-subunit alcohol dehydrogenase family)